jgi:NTE family protein
MAGTNVRTQAAVARLNPLNIRRQNAAADTLEGRYEETITKSAINQLPGEPGFVFCATDLTFRCHWWVDSRNQRAGNDVSGWISTNDDYWTIARAVAASSCFPGVFPPMEVDVSRATGAGKAKETLPGSKPVRSIDVTDGGVFDNLGVEPVWTDHTIVLVSDASPSFGPSPDLGPIWPSIRPIVSLLEQATVVRKRWLISNFLKGDLEGAYWGIASLPRNYGTVPGSQAYDGDLIERYLSQVRIELDAFSPAEMGILENHGYLMCDLAIRKHLPSLPSIAAPLQPPHPALMERSTVERELKSSHRYKLLGRGDWR